MRLWRTLVWASTPCLFGGVLHCSSADSAGPAGSDGGLAEGSPESDAGEETPGPVRPIAIDLAGVLDATVWIDGAGVPAGYATPVQTTHATATIGRVGYPALPASVHVLNLHVHATGYVDYGCTLLVDGIAPGMRPAPQTSNVDFILGPWAAAFAPFQQRPIGANGATCADHLTRLPMWSQSQLSDVQGDLMIRVPAVKPDCTNGEDPTTHLRCVGDNGAVPQGIIDGWVWTLTLGDYSPQQQETILQAYVAKGYTHFAQQIACTATVPPGTYGYHGITPLYPCDGAATNALLHKIIDHGLIPVCAPLGGSPQQDQAPPGLDRSLCPIVMTEWDDLASADCQLQLLGAGYPAALHYFELPGNVAPVPDACSPNPFPATGDAWIQHAKQAYGLSGMFVEINEPDGMASNLAQLQSMHAWWMSTQEVLFETNTYFKFWNDLDDATATAYDDGLLAAAPWLRGYMSGATSHVHMGP
jgi:hypothetical protein